MKIQKFLALVLLGTSSLMSSEMQATDVVQTKQKKIYVDSQSIKVSNGNIVISICGQQLPISALFSDEKGIFISELQLQKIPGYVEKRVCHCRQCGRSFISSHYRRFCSDACERKHERGSLLDRYDHYFPPY